MTTETIEIVGYFSYDCQPDGYCTYGCGKKPQTVCEPCAFHETWLEGIPVPENFHPIMNGADDTFVGECDLCGEVF